MNYWLVNPKNEGSSTDLSDKTSDGVYMGWDEKICPKFYNEVKKGDVIIVAEGSHRNNKIHFIGIAENLDKKEQYWQLSYSNHSKNDEISDIIKNNPSDFGGGESLNPWGPTKSIIKLGNNPFEAKVKSILESYFTEIKMKVKIQHFSELLSRTHNLILTGAPGTGKTYLAKQIAEALGCTDNEIEFVQFHPSYDYTDFVEGLRPIQDDNGNVGFERKDGVFKAFCKKALEKFDTNTFDVSFDKLLMSIGDGETKDLHTPSGKKFSITPNSKGNLRLITGADSKENGVLTKERIKAEFLGSPIDKWWKGYYCGVVNCLKEEFNLQTVSINTNRPFVFIIDEINRGEISKIFGELFFSIDPGYRGEKGRVQTQYQNIVEDGDIFKKGFFVPENVYIIGTMNDIDRSVESMDFAFRRRFAFKEVTATDSQKMLDSDDAWDSKKPNDEIITSIKDRMDNLNNKIWHKPTNEEKDEDKYIEGLSSAYHIGASYFLKLANYKKDDGTYDFDKLWEYHLEGLLREYLRGMTDVETKIEELHKAYDNGAANGQQP